MNTFFIKNQGSFLIKITIITVLIFGIHTYLAHYFLADIILFFSLWQIYIFQFVVTTIIYTIINYKHSTGNKLIFNTFMAGTLLKMLFSMIFLVPLFLAKTENKEPDVFNFFIAYFLFLIFEVISLNKLLNR